MSKKNLKSRVEEEKVYTPDNSDPNELKFLQSLIREAEKAEEVKEQLDKVKQ